MEISLLDNLQLKFSWLRESAEMENYIKDVGPETKTDFREFVCEFMCASFHPTSHTQSAYL